MTRRHDEIYSEWDRLTDDDPRIDGLSAESIQLAHRIVIFPVTTKGGSAEKKRIIQIADIEIATNHWMFRTGSDFIQFIHQLDRERIAAAG
jgi:DNA polymerase III epsilon subunit-like protein